jgi:hypothetical protein
VFAFDPQASSRVDTAIINNAIIQLPWEKPWEDPVEVGPVNEYLEVIDFDPASGCFYEPVDITHKTLLAQNGLPPSDANPQFHQQMVFAVAMKTVRTFEKALGRHVLWMKERTNRSATGTRTEQDFPNFVRRLRIYPHAMREANAYYSPERTALLFGYFRGAPARDATGGEWVFTCLSQDIIAHETTHAILHGLWRRSVESANVDSLAFHEAFADIVALFQHFSSRPVIEHQLARSGGNLRSIGLLTSLAAQFGHSTGREGPLRFALQMLVEEEEKLARNESIAPDRNAGIREPHKRGQILVAAIFDAFVAIFERRTEDLLRMNRVKRGTTEALPQELVTRLAEEAEGTAGQVLKMCIRALDYLPPVDATFGEYLRAIITADVDLVPDDRLHYRTALAEAFSKRGIFVDGQKFTSTEMLCWETPAPFATAHADSDSSFIEVLSRLHLGVTFGAFKTFEQGADGFLADQVRRQGFSGVAGYTAGKDASRNLRDLAMMIVRDNQIIMHEWLKSDSPNPQVDREWEQMLGIRFAFNPNEKLKSIRSNAEGQPAFEVQSVRISRRLSPDGDVLPQLLVKVVQSRRGYFDRDVQKQDDEGKFTKADRPHPDFIFRGGATVIVDLRDGRVQRVIRKRIDDNDRLERVRAFKLGDPSALGFNSGEARRQEEPFAMLHRSGTL